MGRERERGRGEKKGGGGIMPSRKLTFSYTNCGTSDVDPMHCLKVPKTKKKK